MKKIKEEESIEILKIHGLIENIKLLWKYGWRKHKPRIYIKKCRWNKKLFPLKKYSKMNRWVKSVKGFVQP